MYKKYGLETSSRPICVYKELSTAFTGKTNSLKQADRIGYAIAELSLYHRKIADISLVSMSVTFSRFQESSKYKVT